MSTTTKPEFASKIPVNKGGPEKDPPTKQGFSAKQLILGLLFGVLFGFLLQKGGVAKFHILIGVLLLEDFTVVKVMLTAIIVGSVGIFSMYGLGLVQLHIKPTRYAANIIGGLIFGIGFGLLGYCPGTGAAALGQGNWDAIAGIVGLMLGSYLFAEASGWLDKTLLKIGDRGKLMLPEVVGLPLATFLCIFIPLLIVGLIALDQLVKR
ncbi:MAG: YeeE/YedE thiosulfate transporter family protein [Pirellulaceae bacterium]|nr:YeeE/YedE thiosulfate transporter family protein [Pirellulaceae bacterium]